MRLRCARFGAAAAMLNPYREASGGDKVDDSGIGRGRYEEAAALARSGCRGTGLGLAAPRPPPNDPQEPEGNIGAPPEGSTIQILHCSGLPAKNSIPPCVLQPHPWRAAPGYAHATPPVRPMENYEWHYQPKLGSRELLRAWENLVGRGGGEKVLEAVGRWPLHLFQLPCFPGVAEPQRNQAAQIWRVAYSL
ncbi:Hypothetical predicted protein [Marmota monax]|uniref:Uncharacterized protein n=1 Tax=Marmota monax TaxID=9995 RepID=A0A5E4BSF3_MARMO|nr:hypothetical protein GHT09_016413 [Marmota monax]VTJ71970.1 Hypothetical predicted protein [Marmota monax]